MKLGHLIEPDEFTRRLSGSLWATARGEAAPFAVGRQWRPDHLLCALDDGSGPVAAMIPGEFERFEPVTGEMDRDACVHALAVMLDCIWLDLQAKRGPGAPLGNDAAFFWLWGSVRELMRPWLETGEPLSPAIEAEAEEAWAETMRVVFEGTLLAFPEVAAAWAAKRGRVIRTPGQATVVDLCRVRTRKPTMH